MNTKAETAKKQRSFACEATVDGYEPVLRIWVNGDGSVESHGAQLLTSFEPSGSMDVDYFAPSRWSEPYVSPEAVDADDRLEELLREPFGPDGHAAPVAGGNSRLLVDVDSELYEEHEFVTRRDERDQEIARILVQYLMLYHEMGATDGSGGHFSTLIDPETAVIGSVLPWSDIHSTLWDGGNVPRALPKQYPETYAVLEEMELVEQLRTASSPFRELRESVPMHAIDDSRLKAYDRDDLDEMLRSLERNYIEEGDVEFGRDSRTIRTATYLRDEVGLDRARELMEVPRRASMNPDKWVCDVLHDLESGMDPEEIPHHSNYWEMRPPVEHDHEYQEVVERTERQRQKFVYDRTKRARNSTYEVVRLHEDGVSRTWYSKRPTVPFSLEHIRYCLFLQYLFTAVETTRFSVDGEEWGLRVVNNGQLNGSAKYEPTSDSGATRSFYEAGYQRDDAEPYKLAMDGELTPRQIAYYFDYDSNKVLSHYGWKMAANQAASNMEFTDFQSLRHWIETGEVR